MTTVEERSEMQHRDAAVPPRSREQNDEGRGARGRRQWSLKLGRWWWALPALIMVAGIHYAATIAGGIFAFTDWSGIGDFNWVGLENFRTILADPTMIRSVWNTLFLAFGMVIVSNIAGLALGVALNRGLKTRYALRVLFFMPVVLSPLAVSYVWKFVFEYDGPLNILLAGIGLDGLVRPWVADPTFAIWTVLVVLVWQNTGIAMVLYLAGLASVAPEMEEAAAIDGAGLWKRFIHVVLPALRPAVMIATTLGLVNGLRVFDQIMALTGGGPAGSTENLATLVYKQAFSLGQFGQGAALALILTVVILIFAVLQQRIVKER